MQRLATIGAMLTAFCLLATSAQAASYDALLNKLVEKGILTRSDAQDVRQELIAEAKQQKDGPSGEKADYSKNSQMLEFGGDIRLRNEYRNRTGTDNDNNRQRIRARLSMTAKVNSELEAKMRLATGSTADPVSTNDSFNDAFNKKPFNLDLAYLKWTPELVSEGTAVEVEGGILENPLWTASPLVWDGDLSFDGASVKLSQKAGLAKVFFEGGVFSLDTEEQEPASLWTVQGGIEVKPGKESDDEFVKNLKLKSAVSYVDYKNVSSTATTDVCAGANLAGCSAGNTSSGEDFNLVNAGVELGSQLAEIPMKTWFDYVHNVGAADNDDGFQVGFKVGKAKKFADPKKGWEAGYFYQRLQSDAAFGPYADSDFHGGGTNNKGNVYFVNFATLKNSTLGMKYFDTEQLSGAKAHTDTFQVDWVTKF